MFAKVVKLALLRLLFTINVDRSQSICVGHPLSEVRLSQPGSLSYSLTFHNNSRVLGRFWKTSQTFSFLVWLLFAIE